MRLLLPPLLALVLLAALARAHVHSKLEPFEVGQKIEIECRDSDDGWTDGIVCSETGERLSVEFGRDSFVYCGWKIEDEEEYERVRLILQQKEAMECRVPMSADRHFFLPLAVQLWGIVEETHVHVNYHVNFIFHAAEGSLLGAASYPVRDRFQYVKAGSTLNLHGPVRWFSRHSFTSFGENGGAAGGGDPLLKFVTIVAWVMLSAGTTSMFFIAFYAFYLKPRLAKRYLKND